MPARTAWQVSPPQPREAAALARHLGVLPAIAQALLNRGQCQPDTAARFLSPSLDGLHDPFQLPDMDRAVERLRRALRQREVIGIFGDSDVDGITASAILDEGLRALGGRALVRLSNRLADGYGFPPKLIRRISRLGLRLVVLVDCGTNQRAEIEELAARRIDTIVLDHHLPTEHRARPHALVNSRMGPPAVSGLCSAGLALKVIQALCPAEVWRERLDLAALGTLADYAPLVEDNRVIVREGLPKIMGTARPGLRRLGEDVRLTQPTVDQVLKRLVPRLNASGRMGRPRPVWRLLVETSETTAHRLADRLAEVHRHTKALSRRLSAEANEQASRMHFRDQWIMVVGRRGWHPGLMGPLAAQLAERFQRPAIAIAFDGTLGVGSGRSGASFNLFEALESCRSVLVRYGGHPQACGLTIEPSQLETFRLQINQHARQRADRSALSRRLAVDVQLSACELTPRFAEEAGRLAPFGSGNPPVRVMACEVEVRPDGEGSVRLCDRTGTVAVRGGVRGLSVSERYDVVVAPALRQGACAIALIDARRSRARSSSGAGCEDGWDEPGSLTDGGEDDEGRAELTSWPAPRGSAP